MRKLIYKIILALLVFSGFYSYSQNTVIHDVPWHSDTIGVWGSGSTAWSINRVDTLADVTVGPYSDQYSAVYNIPFPISDSVGVIFDYGAYADLQLIFAMTGWDGGASKINYPTRITMDFPPNGSFQNGSWETIPSEYREQDTIVHPSTDYDNWDIYADWPDAGRIELFLNMDVEAHADLIYSDPTDPFNITWDTLHVFDPIDIHLDTFDIFLADLVNNEYVIPWVDYHTDPITGLTVIDSVYFLHDSIGWPMQFPAIFYDLIGISGDISIPNIQNYVKWIENEQRLYTWGSDEYMHINLDIVKFVQVTTHYLSNIPSFQGLAAVSQALEYEEGDTSIYIFTDPISGEDFTADLTWDLIDAELMFTNSMNQTLSFEDNQEYTFFGIPIPPDHYPNVWNVFEFPFDVDYKVLDTLGVEIEAGTTDSIRFCADYDLQLRLPCNDLDTLPVTITHTIDPWFTNMVRDSIDVDFYLKVLEIAYSIGTPSNPVISGNYLLFEDTFNLGTFAGPPLFGPPLFMPWQIDGFFIDTTFVPDVNIVPDNNPLSDSIYFSDVLCYGTTTGTATIVGIGGVQPYTYIWEDTAGIVISTNSTINNIGIGDYYVTITDDNGCQIEDSLSIINTNTEIVVSHNVTDVLCFGDSTGVITENVSGGTPGYQYTWNNNAPNSSTITGLNANTYYLTVTDNVGCVALDTIEIINLNPPLVITTLATNNITCYSGNDGLIDIDVTGGVANYSYWWSNGLNTQDAVDVIADTFTVIVTDNVGCTISDTWELTQPDEIIINSQFQNVSCYGGNNAAIQVDVTGGVANYTYTWQTSNGSGLVAGQQNQTDLTIGTYNLTVTDANNCTKTETWTITQPDVLQIITDNTQNITCFGGNDGQINISVIGGVGSYVYNWQTVDGGGLEQAQQDQPNLIIGTYNLTVTDGNNCTISDNWTLIQPPLLEVFTNPINISCFGETDGEISISTNGGVPPYTYNWETNNGTGLVNTDQNQSDLTAGTYYLTVTDSHNCTNLNEIEVIEPNKLIISVTENQTICKNSSATVTISAIGGTPPYSYYWNNILSNYQINVSPISDTTIIASVIDSRGCVSNTESTTISIAKDVQLSLSQNLDEVCAGDEVAINADITGGVQPYVLTDNLGNTLTQPIIYVPEQTGYYNITVSDACNLKSSDEVYITVNQSPNISISADKNSGCSPLLVNFVNNSTSTTDTYIWNFGDNITSTFSNPLHVYKQSGTFNVELTAISDKGCVTNKTLTNYINVWPNPNAKFEYLPLVPTFINSNVSFTNLSEGASAYLWSFGDGATSNLVNPNHTYGSSGTYLVNLVALSSYGCKDTVLYSIEVKDGMTFYAPTAFSPDHDDINNDFYILGTGIQEDGFVLTVYDRWGEIVWQTTKYNADTKMSAKWNGVAKDNSVVESGVYKWLVNYKDINGISHEESGNVTVIK